MVPNPNRGATGGQAGLLHNVCISAKKIDKSVAPRYLLLTAVSPGRSFPNILSRSPAGNGMNGREARMARNTLTITVKYDSPIWNNPDFGRELTGILGELQGKVSEAISVRFVRFGGVAHPTNGFVVAEVAYANELFASVIRIGGKTDILSRVPGFESYMGGFGEISWESIQTRLTTCLWRRLRRRAETADALMTQRRRELEAISEENRRAGETPNPAA